MSLIRIGTLFLVFVLLGATLVAPDAKASELPAEPRKRIRPLKKKIFTIPVAEPKSEYSIATSFEAVRSTSLYDLKNGAKYDGMDYGAGLSFSMPIGTLSTKLSVTQVLSPTDDNPTVLNDSHIGYTYTPIKLITNPQNVDLVFIPGVLALIPLSDRSKKVEQMQTAVIASAALQLLAGEQTALNGLSLGVSLSLGQNFYQHETDVNGTALNKNSSNQAISVGYTVGTFSLGVSYANRIRWPYAGETRYAFELSEEVSVKFLKNWAVQIGHTNAGSTLKPNGYDSNVSLADEDNSVVYIGLSFGFGGAL